MRTLTSFAASVFLPAIFLAASTAFAQDPPVTWGEIPKADLEMRSYPPDTVAEALVLCDYGESAVNNDLGVTFARHLRVKIFTSKGYEWGTRVISLYTGGHDQKLEDLEGVTYSLGSDGKIVETELDDASVFEEKVDEDRTRYRFTMPALKPGCVFEIRYRITSRSSFRMNPWVFQTAIPVAWSEYRMIALPTFGYASVTQGYESFAVHEQTQVARRLGGRAATWGGGELVQCNQMRWVLRNVPAMREEPFVKNMGDYATSVKVQLAEYVVPGGGVEKVLKEWGDVIENLLQSKDFGKQADPSGEVRRTAERVTAGCTTALEKMTALYDFVRSTVVWDGTHQVWPAAGHGQVLSTKKGGSADIVFLLLALLRSVEIEAYPAILSTRAHGEITDVFPLIEQFNSVIARATVGGKTYDLDATDPMRTIDLLPVSVLNVRALIIKPGPPQWVRLTTSKGYVGSAWAKLGVGQGGEIRGTFQCEVEDYGALAVRKELADRKLLDAANDLFDAKKTGFTLDSVAVSGQDSSRGPLVIKANATSGSYVQVAGDHMYINPVVIDRTTSNPFTLKVRKFPVDMAYPRNLTSGATFVVPDGYVIKELPRQVTVDLDMGAGAYSRQVTAAGSEVTVVSRLLIQRAEFPPTLYKSLKDFYDRIVALEAEQIVLERKPLPPANVTPAPAAPKKKKGGS